MKNYLLPFSTGFALFSMFFGSGNLVFPITVGFESEGHYLAAALGILLTGVVVPFLGVYGMMLYQGDIEHFFRFFGKKGTFIFCLLSLALMGPFGVLARCLTVAHGALLLLFPYASLPVSSFCLCASIFVLVLNRNKIISLLGNILTPFLLISIAAIVIFGVGKGSFDAPATAKLTSLASFKNGFFQGYQTMDLLAAFFFSQFVIRHLLKTSPHDLGNQSVMKHFTLASIIGASLLSAVYFVLVVLGFAYAPLLTGKPPEEMLGLIALESLGAMAAPCVCLAIIFACVTTALVLTTLFADFLRKDVSQDKLGHKTTILITLAIGFGVSNLEFSGIAKFLGPLLETVYPALIALSIYNIAYHYLSREQAPAQA